MLYELILPQQMRGHWREGVAACSIAACEAFRVVVGCSSRRQFRKAKPFDVDADSLAELSLVHFLPAVPSVVIPTDGQIDRGLHGTAVRLKPGKGKDLTVQHAVREPMADECKID